ncbi:MAG: MBL fold metallo-hydrolase [Desulfocapsaceae bacterium]|nr:MBL fold metallo-hydrolase [Desulfocapsaceae bacterium]
MQDCGLKIGEYEIFWLNGGEFALDGGAMFGPVPKGIWSKRYPVDEENYIRMMASPMLIKGPNVRILVESGFGNKLTEKQRKIFHVQREWDLVVDLAALGIRREEIDAVVLTHGDWDHAGGVAMVNDAGEQELTFPAARHFIQTREWEDIRHPTNRSGAAYWPVNFDALAASDLLTLVDESATVAPGITLRLTGGHTRGHQVIFVESQGERAVHLGDLLPTQVHFNPLWGMAYDNYPLDVIARKQELIKKAVEEQAWLLFYHNPFLNACKFDVEGKLVEIWPPADSQGDVGKG